MLKSIWVVCCSLLVFNLLPGSLAHGSENLGRLALSDLYLEPSFSFREPRQGGFDEGHSYAGFEWRLNSYYSGHVSVGSATLINRPRFYGNSSSALALTEAYAQADTAYGRVRMGMIPLCYGLENSMREGELLFPRSLIFSKKFVPMRDIGFSYFVDAGGFYTEMIAHNGESGDDLDSQVWFTVKWGWKGSGFDVAASASTGRTTPDATDPNHTSSSTTTDFDPTLRSKFRLVNAYVKSQMGNWNWALEGNMAHVDQESQASSAQGGHVDLSYSFPHSSWDLLARYDTWQEKWPTETHDTTELTVGTAYHSPYRNSVISLYGVKVLERGITPDSHQVKIVWKLTPKF